MGVITLQAYCVLFIMWFIETSCGSVQSFADIGNGLLLSANPRHRWISFQIRLLLFSQWTVQHPHHSHHGATGYHHIIWPGCGLSCYQCRSDEISECGDPFISSRFDHHHCFHIFPCHDAVLARIECLGSQGRSVMCSTPSPAASATKPHSLVGLSTLITFSTSWCQWWILIFRMKMIRGWKHVHN